MLTPSSMHFRIREIAHEVGFADCRIAAVTGPAPHAELFQNWIDAGCHGDMAWMARNPHRRKDPREVLPGAKSVVVVALNYLSPPPRAVPPDSGIIARYAWGDDYHDLMEEKLRRLGAEFEKFGGHQKWYVDTGPVLERDWASAAGLGWNGKSTLQIHEKLGGWFFLGEILTTLELAPDLPAADRCGKCVRCISACPTGAIDRPHHVDARRCISYLTIEHKGAIPVELRRAIGGRIYGCDDCLAACPWNRFAQASKEASFAARPFVFAKLRDLLSLTEDDFRTMFRASPIKRIKRPAFLRNVCVALGNIGTPEDVPALEAAAAEGNPLIAEHAAWAVAEIRLRAQPTGIVSSGA